MLIIWLNTSMLCINEKLKMHKKSPFLRTAYLKFWIHLAADTNKEKGEIVIKYSITIKKT